MQVGSLRNVIKIMKISKLIETADGAVRFEGDLSADELEVVIGCGLNYLMRQGALPFKVTAPADFSSVQEGSESVN